MELKEMCKAVRRVLGISQKRLAEMIGTTQTEISFIEGGFTPPHEGRVQEIKNYYEEIKEKK